MICCGLDLGENVAYVRGGAVGPVTFGTFTIPASVRRLGAWYRHTDDLWRELFPGCDRIAYEQPFMGKDIYAARKLFGQAALVSYWADLIIPGAQVQPIMIATGKHTLSGDKHAGGERMIAAAAERGYPDMNVHEAHALGVWWAATFGPAEPIRSPRSRSGPGQVVT